MKTMDDLNQVIGHASDLHGYATCLGVLFGLTDVQYSPRRDLLGEVGAEDFLFATHFLTSRINNAVHEIDSAANKMSVKVIDGLCDENKKQFQAQKA